MLKKVKKLLSLVLAAVVCAAGIGVAPLSANAASVPTEWQKGANLPCWYDTSYDSLNVLKAYGYNAVNLNWNTSLSASELDKYLTKCEGLGLAPTVSLWDANGKSSYDSLQKCADYWVRDDVAGVMKNHPSAVLEVAAGWDASDLKTWEESYMQALQKIDDRYQYGCKVALSAPSCATDAKAFAQAFMAVRAKFIHIHIEIVDISWIYIEGPDFYYWQLEIRETVIDIYLVEYSFCGKSSSTSVAESDKEFVQICKDNNIGFYPYIWCGDPSGNLNMTSDWKNYTDRGKYLAELMFS